MRASLTLSAVGTATPWLGPSSLEALCLLWRNRFKLYHSDGRIRVRRSEGERYIDACVRQTDGHVMPSIIVCLGPHKQQFYMVTNYVQYLHRINWGYIQIYRPDSKVLGTNVGPIWGRQDPGGPHVGPMNFAIWEDALLFANHLYPWIIGTCCVMAKLTMFVDNEWKFVSFQHRQYAVMWLFHVFHLSFVNHMCDSSIL